MRNKVLYLFVLLVGCLASCTTHVPQDAASVSKEVSIYPDYKEVTVPQGIAPLNFLVENVCEKAIVALHNEQGEELVVKGNSRNEIIFNEKEWKRFTAHSQHIECTPYLLNEKRWNKFNSFQINILDEPIDSFITYRLIEPSFMSTGQIGLYQFDLTNGEEQTIIRRCQNITVDKNHEQSCVNCHSAQKGNPNNKMFYYRGENGGLLLTYNGKITKINTKVQGMFSGTTYPAWHPTLPYIVFSSNDVLQDFPTIRKGKTEFYDRRTDLILFDIEKNEIFIINPSVQLETNPTWSPDGEYVYFALSDSLMTPNVMPEFEYPKLKYDIARTKFDPATKSFSKPEIVWNVTKEGKSATFPRISPDGKFLLVVISEFGASPHTHPDGDLFAMNLETKEVFNCEAANSQEAESYHDFSTRSNWFVFYSRREDGNYGRAYISHIDSTGKCTKPFQLPHKDPQMDRKRLKVYNMIEFANSPVKFNESDFYDVIWNGELVQANSDPRNNATDGASGASVIRHTDGNSGATAMQKGQSTDGNSGATTKRDSTPKADGHSGASVMKKEELDGGRFEERSLHGE